jgi:ATP-dependent DNA helicase RecQ
MKNQVDQMLAFGINAQFLNSSLTRAEINRVKAEVISGAVKLLYIAPESLNKQENLNFLKQAKISFVAIDEAHCISEWGHDFRPEYRKIRTIIETIDEKMPIIALTATATPADRHPKDLKSGRCDCIQILFQPQKSLLRDSIEERYRQAINPFY